ncbi:DMT family transporter [Janthinobacterium lividum]|uniref:DMT family transporter n=1 Tax=Janthinobacterium lividum TaxID=29581 RepID=UPI00140CCE9D|nr:DMT family transporter [Janthinobacterium lividum]NHQ94062.1 DMT family transporter [Janthinobacterium lividum]
MNALLLPIAFCAGIAIALQTTLNGQLARSIGGDSLTASLVSFIIGGLFLALIALLRGGTVPSLAQVPAQPLWSLLGGMLGAGALLCNVLLAPRIGLTLLVGLAVVGQLMSSLVIDHFALLGATARPISAAKLVGALLMIAGLTVLVFGDRVSRALNG